jgi:hypothetical protein
MTTLKLIYSLSDGITFISYNCSCILPFTTLVLPSDISVIKQNLNKYDATYYHGRVDLFPFIFLFSCKKNDDVKLDPGSKPVGVATPVGT